MKPLDKYFIRAAFALSLVAGLAGCTAVPTPPPPTTPITAKVPVITALPETKESQEKGGIEIAVVPANYQTAKKEKYSVSRVEPGFGAMVGGSIASNGKSDALIYVLESATPFLDVQPVRVVTDPHPRDARLEFTIRINNKLARVFRGQGSVVQINVDGKLIPFEQIDYSRFLNGIVPPRNETSVTILGPSLSSMPDKTTIGVFLYDVVTATDVAGNVTEKQNYEWYFDYSVKTATENAPIRKSQRYMQVPEYQHALLLAKKRSLDEPDPTEAGR